MSTGKTATCTICNKMMNPLSLKKHHITLHAPISEKIMYFGSNYCKLCDYGITQNDKFNKHLESKNHLNKLKQLEDTKENKNMILEFILNRLKTIHKIYPIYTTYYFYKITICDEVYIKSSKKNYETYKNKYPLSQEHIKYIESANIKSKLERELLEDKYIKSCQDLNMGSEIQNNISKILYDEQIQYEQKKVSIINMLDEYEQNTIPILKNMEMLLKLKPTNLNISCHEADKWHDIDNNLLIYNCNDFDKCYYNIDKNNTEYYFQGLENIYTGDITYDNRNYFSCIYRLCFEDGTTIYILRKYKGKTINIINKNLIYTNTFLINKIIQMDYKFQLHLVYCFNVINKNRNTKILKDLVDNINNTNDIPNINTYILDYLKVDKTEQTNILKINNINNIIKLDNNKIIQSLASHTKGAPTKFLTEEAKKESTRQSKLKYKSKIKLQNAKKREEKEIEERENMLSEEDINIIKKMCKEQTVKKHVSILNTMLKLKINIKNFDETEMKKVCEKYTVITTLANYLISIRMFLRQKECERIKSNGETSKPIIKTKMKEYSNQIKYLSIQITNLKMEMKIDYNNSKILTLKQKKNFVPWATLIETRRHIETGYGMEKTREAFEQYLYFCLFTMLPPRRLRDYKEMVLDTSKTIYNDPTCILKYFPEGSPNNYRYNQYEVAKNKTSDTKNYLTKKDDIYYFIFNNYKTTKSYGKQIVQVPADLSLILTQYINTFGLKNGNKIINGSDDYIDNLMQTICKKYVHKNLSINSFRHIFINYWFETKNFVDYEKITVANLMGHSYDTQHTYNKEVIEDEGYTI